MERILDFIKWSLVVLLLLVLVWAALAATKWLPQPTDVQRKALLILSQPPATATGRHNAFAAIWLSQYDIPNADLETVANADLARYRESAAGRSASFVSTAEGRYRKQELPDGYAHTLCPAAEPDCLAKIRAHPDVTRELLAANALLLDHARALAGYDYYHDRLPPFPDSPLPQIGGTGMLLLGDAALHFVDGDRQEGLARACSAALTWKRLALHADSRVVQSVAGSYYIGASVLVADMRAELPADTPPPAACAAAFAPIPDASLDVCDTMKIEFTKNAVALREVGDPLENHPVVSHGSRWSQILGRLLINGEAAVAYSATPYASFCTRDADVQREAERLDVAILSNECEMQQSLFDPIGCSLANLGNPRRWSPSAKARNLQRMDLLMSASLVRPGPTLAGSTVATSGSAATTYGLPDGVEQDPPNHALRIPRAYRMQGENPDFSIPLPGSRLH